MDFVFIANAWGAKQDNPTSKHQIAMELARSGSKILWVEGSGMRRPSLGSGADRSKISAKIRKTFSGAQEVAENIWRLSPLFVPYPQSELMRRLNGQICVSAVNRWKHRLGLANPIMINYVPVLSEAMRLWRRQSTEAEKQSGAVRSIYHCVDLWSGFGMYDNILMDKLDEECCRNADVVVASSHVLYEACSRRNPRTYEVMHGVDHGHFSSAINTPKALPGAEGRKVIGFVGLISEWVDQDLLVSLARRFKDDKIVLIGNADVDCSKLKGEANIIMTGPKPYSDIPSYISAFTVGIIPFKVNDLTRAVNPIKLREMMAAGCPVVSTDLPEVSRYLHQKEGFSDYIGVAGNAEAFIAKVRRFVEKSISVEKKRALSVRMQDESWPQVAEKLLRIIERENEDV